MDNYTEQIVECRADSGGYKMKKTGINIIVVSVLLSLFGFIFLGIMLLGVGLALAIFGSNVQGLEYEYLFVNGDLEVSAIKNKASRKVVYEMQEGEVQKIWLYDLPKAKNELEVNNRLTVKNYTSGRKDMSDRWYIFFTNGKNTTNAVILELDDNNIVHINNVFKKKIETK